MNRTTHLEVVWDIRKFELDTGRKGGSRKRIIANIEGLVVWQGYAGQSQCLELEA